MYYALIGLAGLVAGIALDELFAGKVVSAVKVELDKVHAAFDKLHEKLDAIIFIAKGGK